MANIRTYFVTRFTTLYPSFDGAPNPFKLLGSLNRRQWMFFFVGFIGWTWDAFDFFTISLTVQNLATTFHRSKTDITWGITVTLMFRCVGAAIFGIAGDCYGRKWPFIINNVLLIILEMATGFTNTYKQFLAVRSLYGIAMGGLYGNAIATALEDAPVKTRGILSGILQQGYAVGYLLATIFARALVNTTSHEWRPLFWFGACPPVLIIVFRLLLPETDNYQERQMARRRNKVKNVTKVFFSEGKIVLKRYPVLLAYMVLLMTGFSFIAHGSQDLYPTMLSNQYNFSTDKVTVTQVVANLGAVAGGAIMGYSSQIFGRRFIIICVCVAGGALLYPYSFIGSNSVMAAAFFEQFMVQGAFGVIPVHLSEISPQAFRVFVVGVTFQLGTLAASASATIESAIGDRFPLLPTKSGVSRYKYGTVICILMSCAYVYSILLTFIGPEHRGRDMHIEDGDETILATIVSFDPETQHRGSNEEVGESQHEKEARRDSIRSCGEPLNIRR